jgi:uncharacterized protein (TIRG00374 family)
MAAAALIVLLVAREASQWRQFQWSAFWRYASSVSAGWVVAAVAAIYGAYVVRAVRWRVLAGFEHSRTLALFPPTVIGFTAMALLGRAGELVRPWLISTREQVSFESQALVWVMERLFDTAAAVVLVAAGLASSSRALPYVESFRSIGVIALLAVLAAAVVVALLAWRAEAVQLWLIKRNSRSARFCAARMKSISRAANILSSPARFLTSTLLSFAMWLLVAAAYLATLQSFRPPAANLNVPSVFVLMGFSMAGSLIPLPGAAGQQMGVVAALVAVFGLPSDLAVSCGILLWLTTWISIVPVGLVLLRREGFTLKSVLVRRSAATS